MAALLSAASLFRHERFGSNAYDLGIFDQTIWGYSTLRMIPNTVLRLPNALGDHFHPILMLLAPLYWLWDDVRVLLVAQAVLLAAASLPLFAWARRELGVTVALLFQTAYLAYWAVLGGNIFDFHDLSVAAPIVSLALYALLTKRDRLLLVTLALGLLTREDVALTFVGIGAFVALVQRRWRFGGAVALLSSAWFALTFKVIIPAFAGRAYSHWAYSQLGPDPVRALVHLVVHPFESAKLFFTPRDKAIALFNLFAPWLFLPLLSPLVLVMLPTLAARFFSDKPSHWAPQGFHYSVVLAPVIAFAAVDTTARLRRFVGPRAATALPVAVAGVTLAAGLYFSFGRLRPLDELRRYTTPAHVAQIETCLQAIPEHASVSATSALVPHLTHRRSIYVLDHRPVPETDVYAFDLSTWTYPFDRDDVARLVDDKRAQGYGVRCSQGSTAVLERGAPAGTLSPQLGRLLGAAGQP